MENKNVMDLVDFAEQAAVEKWGYVWGAGGEVYTKEIAESLHKIYGTAKYDKEYYTKTQMNLWKGRKVADCSGLIQAFRGTDDTAQGLYNKCRSKGELRTFNNHIGYLVFCMSSGKVNHVGVVVSNGHVVHATSSAKGVIKERLSTSTRGWTHWGRAHFIDYLFKLPVRTIVKGSVLNDVCWLQSQLNKSKHIFTKLEVDGVYGSKTATAYKIFSRSRNWQLPDGWSVGSNGIKSLGKLL